MKVKDNKATATLTDVKNKIGDVFSLVDKHGEVTITSYNKPAYVIAKYVEIKEEEKPEEQEDLAVKTESKKDNELPKLEEAATVPIPVPTPTPTLKPEPMTEPEKPEVKERLTQQMEIPRQETMTDTVVGFEEVPVAPTLDSDRHIDAETELHRIIAQELAEEENTKPVIQKSPEPEVTHPVANTVEEAVTILAGTTYGEIWNRANAKEKAWVANTKELL